MKVTLINNTDLWVASKAIRKCWDSENKSDSCFVSEGDEFDFEEVYRCGEKDKALIERVANQNRHSSTIEHLNYTFDIQGISRALLQEFARHRHQSLSVKSTRYTLKELKNEASLYNISRVGFDWHWDLIKKYCVLTNNKKVNECIANSLFNLKELLKAGVSNDIAKYALPEAYITSLVSTFNARSLQNFLSLRTSKFALKEIRELANEMFNQLPQEHKYLFEDSLYKENIKNETI